MKTQPSVPRLSESNLLRYLSQIFKVPSLTKCKSAEQAIKKLRETECLYLPEGFDETCTIVYERTNVRGNLWNIGPKSELTQMALENGTDYCLLIPDVTLTGADSLFLCALYESEGPEEMNSGISSLVDSWTRCGCPKISITGYRDKEHGGTVHIAAAQLKSLV